MQIPAQSEALIRETVADTGVKERPLRLGGEEPVMDFGRNAKISVDHAIGMKLQVEDRFFGVIVDACQQRRFYGNGRTAETERTHCADPSISACLFRLGKRPPPPQTSRGYERLLFRRGSLPWAA